MTADTIQLTLAPTPMDAAGRINSIRLVAQAGGAALASLHDSRDGAPALSLSRIEGQRLARPQPLFNLKSPFGAPFWDVTNAANGVAAVWTRPGSAISPLVSRRAAADEVVLTSQYPMGVFQSPRFVRGEQGTAVTAVTEQDNANNLVLFREVQGPYVTLPAGGPGIPLDGLLLRRGAGYLLFALLQPPGPRAAERADLRGESLPPGVLVCVPLNANFQAAGERTRPFGDTPVFEFDADVSGDRLFLIATARRGYVAARALVTDGAVQWTRTLETPESAELVSPSVLALGSTVVGAAIDSTTAQRPVIRVGLYREQP